MRLRETATGKFLRGGRNRPGGGEAHGVITGLNSSQLKTPGSVREVEAWRGRFQWRCY
jgi:hypothetical protein